MTSNRLVYHAINQLAQRIEAFGGRANHHAEVADLEELDKQVKRLAREVYKANTLAEAQVEQYRLALDTMQRQMEQMNQDADQQARQARLEVIRALIPVIDAVEAGLTAGATQARAMMQTAPEAAQVMVGWLQGQRLLRERLLKLLEAEGVVPMLTRDQPFDPYRHVAVKIAHDPNRASGLILAEERRGYLHGETVLRYADVVVNK